MKRFLAMGLLAGAMGVALAGCAGSPLPAYQSPDVPAQITFTNWGLQQAIKVSKVAPERVGAGQLKVTVELYNATNSDVPLDYKYSFTDKAGVALENQTDWLFVKLPPRGFQAFSFTSTSPVDDFRVQLRPAE